MKKILLGLCALSVLYGTSCKKNDDNSGNAGGGIVLDGTSYSTTTAGSTFMVQGPQIAVAGVNNGLGASMVFTFGTSGSPAAGTYKIVDFTTSPAATEVSVGASKITSGQSQSFGSTSSTGSSVTVSISNGKYTVKMPQVTLTGIVGTSGTTTASCDATQQ